MYKIMPFRYERLNNRKIFLSGEDGEYIIIPEISFKKLISYDLGKNSYDYLNLKSKNIIVEDDLESVIRMVAIKYRTKKSFLFDFTSLHMVVPTLCCNCKCVYCQVSSKNQQESKYYMNRETAQKVVETIFKSPSKYIKIEFQGGEPLMNIDIVKYIINYAKELNRVFRKNIQFIVCTNMTLIDREILLYLKENGVLISTSLDGNKAIHSANRVMKNGGNSYDIWSDKIQLANEVIGTGQISALMTTTKNSLHLIKEIIDEYVFWGFNYIFLRSLNPYGMARKNENEIGYTIDEYIGYYKKSLEYIIELNLAGKYIIEGYANILLKKILTPFSTGFVDLQSPSGVGIGGVIYDYNGNVYASDEGRMLAAMGDNKFLIGNVNNQTYEEIFGGEYLVSLINKSCCETLPGCSLCAYMPYCGADPVRSYAETGDIIGNRKISQMCKKNKSIIQYLFDFIEDNDPDIMDVFWSWITCRPLREIKAAN